jgi:hypothetical protein
LSKKSYYRPTLYSGVGCPPAKLPKRPPLDNTHCLACGAARPLYPIYGLKLPGCCLRCIAAARAAVLGFLAAYARQEATSHVRSRSNPERRS